MVNYYELLKKHALLLYGKKAYSLNNKERMNVLCAVLKEQMTESLSATRLNPNDKKEVHYFSAEFLLGKQIDSILENLGTKDQLLEALELINWDYNEILEIEPEPSTGNGGLGRLAACFIDSMAALGFDGFGQGIRYRKGLFRQKFVNGEQRELPDPWLANGQYPLDFKMDGEEVIVKLRGSVRFETVNGRLHAVLENYKPIMAVPYDIPVPGYRNGKVNYLRLWNAESPNEKVLEQCGINFTHGEAVLENNKKISEICDVLYPDDSTYEGKELRLKQEYFMCSAGMQSLVRKFYNRGIDLYELDKYLAVHINDTHPTLCIPELMRILLDDYNFHWDEAWDITTKVCSYTNHTIMQEALERWPGNMVQSLLPRIYMIIQEIDRRFLEVLRKDKGYCSSKIDNMKIIDNNGNINMANLCCMASYSINGVAELHTEILKKDTLKNFYDMYPEKFNNKTNGITHRRWLIQSNPKLSNIFDNWLGEDWRKDLSELNKLNDFKENDILLSELQQVKFSNKQRLAEYINKHNNIIVNPNSIFDVQVKRMHAYKRQLMNILGILMMYNDLLENPNMQFHPMTFIFGAKAAAGYKEMKDVIKLINKTADLINNDGRVNDKMKIVFIENYNVSKAELIIPAADLSEQISTASKEASGTSNMKFALNGALTLGTEDGANVEIHENVGDDNIFIFGLNANEVMYRYNNMHDFNTRHILETNQKINKVMNMLIDGSIPGLNGAGHDIYWTLVNNDYFFVLTDLPHYIEAKYEANRLYSENQRKWIQMCLANIANNHFFTTDRTISEYYKDIWNK